MWTNTTTDDNFTHYEKPDLANNIAEIEKGNYIAKCNISMYYVSINISDKIGLKKNSLKYKDRHDAHIIEVLRKNARNSYKDYLKNNEASYIVAGDQQAGCKLISKKLFNLFNKKTLILSGADLSNWFFYKLVSLMS